MNLKKYLSVIVFTFCALNFSCTKNFEEINTDPNRTSSISPGSLLNPIIYEVSSFNTLRADAFTFDIMQVALPFPSIAGGIHRYDISESAGNSTWSTYFRWAANIKEMLAASEKVNDVNYQAVALTLNAWVYSNLTDCFGDIPFNEAGRAEEEILKPAFNTQQEVYTKILSDLDRANTLFDPAKPMIYTPDILYNNNVLAWKKFCNSLRLRLYLRVSKRQELNATAKLAEILNNPTANPVFTKTDEGAILKISGVNPLISPWGRAIDFTNARATAGFFIDNLNTFNDPRRTKFNTFSRTTTGASTGKYEGIPSGFSPDASLPAIQPSNFNIALVTAPMISLIMTYAEVEFIRAELAQKGIITADAKLAYENGVKAAMEQWGIVIPVNYFTATSTAYNGTLERIMLQKYYALFFNDYQQWFEYRRTGLPVLPKNSGMLNNQVVPVRFRYPTTVASNNRENYLKAVSNMGGDDINTKLWWEK